MNGLKSSHLAILNHLSQQGKSSCQKKSGMFMSHLSEMWQNLIFQLKVKFRIDYKPYHVTTLTTNHDVWSVFVIKRLTFLPAVCEKYAKILLFYTFFTIHI